MQTIELASTGRQITRLGYGCSSVMGGMGRVRSLAVLEAAFDAGVRHFDVAPMYGFGEAEGCLGEFAARHHGAVTVTTKYGIPPPVKKGWLGVARAVAVPVVRALPGLKQRINKAAVQAVRQEAKASYTAAEAQASLERSLKALRVERIDVWLMHDAAADDLKDEALLRFAQDAVAAGKIGAFGVGTDREKLPALLAERPEFCGVVQCEWSVLDAPREMAGSFRIHHRALTHYFRELHAELAADAGRCKRWSDEVGAELADAEVLAALMLKASLVRNPESVVLFSSKNAEHIRHNVEVAEDAALEGPAQRLYAVVQREQGGGA